MTELVLAQCTSGIVSFMDYCLNIKIRHDFSMEEQAQHALLRAAASPFGKTFNGPRE